MGRKERHSAYAIKTHLLRRGFFFMFPLKWSGFVTCCVSAAAAAVFFFSCLMICSSSYLWIGMYEFSSGVLLWKEKNSHRKEELTSLLRKGSELTCIEFCVVNNQSRNSNKNLFYFCLLLLFFVILLTRSLHLFFTDLVVVPKSIWISLVLPGKLIIAIHLIGIYF